MLARNFLFGAAVCFGLGLSVQAYAGQAEARDVARQNNCAPQKIEVYSQQVGLDAPVVYKVSCQKTKMQDDKAPAISGILVACAGSLCHLSRVLVGDDKP